MKEPDTDRLDPGKGAEEGKKSPEYLALDAFARKVLSVSNRGLDSREDATDDLGNGSRERSHLTKRAP